ncbi:MAG TPA: SulP family inorganic anion transporter, partial [Candidatus Limnocylindrales bacterium]
QAIAYADIAGLPPQAGLAAAAAGLVGYALLGTSRQLIVSPTSSTAAISASLVATIAAGDPSRSGELSSALAIVVGIAFLSFGLLKLGFIARFIPAGVQIGFLFGLGLTIIIGQLTKVLGIPGTSGSFVQQLGQFVAGLGEINGWTVAVGATALAVLLVARRVAPALPAALIVVIGGIAAVYLLDLASKGVEVIGTVPGGVPLPALPLVTAAELLALVPGAVAISVVGSAESLTVAQQFADEHREEIVPDQELIANGGSNVLAGLFQGFIVAGGASQSAASDAAGARSQLVSIVVAVLVVVTSVALLPLFTDLPQAVLGAIVISAVLGFVRIDEVRRVRVLRRDTYGIALFALVTTLLLGILPGLMIAVGLSLILLLVRLARPFVATLGRAPGMAGWVAVTREPGAMPIPGVLALRLEAPLLFLNAGLLRDHVRATLAATEPRPRIVILDLSMTPDLDVESLDILVRLGDHVREADAELWLAEVRGPVAAVLRRAGLVEDGPFRTFRTMADAASAAEAPRDGAP